MRSTQKMKKQEWVLYTVHILLVNTGVKQKGKKDIQYISILPHHIIILTVYYTIIMSDFITVVFLPA